MFGQPPRLLGQVAREHPLAAPTPDQWLFFSMEPPPKSEELEMQQAIADADASVDEDGEPIAQAVEEEGDDLADDALELDIDDEDEA